MTSYEHPAFMLACRKEKIYITKAVQAVYEKILAYDRVCVTGVPGAGKSTALRHVALCLESEGFMICIISDPKEFLNYYDNSRKQVFVLDDAFGVYSLSESMVDSWRESTEIIRNALCRDTKLLMASRIDILLSYAMKKNMVVPFDISSTVLFGTDPKYKIGVDEKRGMLRHCMEIKGESENDIHKVLRQLLPYSEKALAVRSEMLLEYEKSMFLHRDVFCRFFPLICKTFTDTDFVKQNPLAFFRYPFHALLKNFVRIKSENKAQFSALLLCTVLKGELTDDFFNPQLSRDVCKVSNETIELLDYIMPSYNLKCPADLEILHSALKSLIGLYVSHNGSTYEMTHALFGDVVTFVYNDPLFGFEYGTSDFIRDRVIIAEKPGCDPDVIVFIDDKNIERLADRLHRDLKSDFERGVMFIFSNPNISDDRLIGCLKAKSNDDRQTDEGFINKLFKCCMIFMEERARKYKNGDVIQYKLIELFVQLGADCNMFIETNNKLRNTITTGDETYIYDDEQGMYPLHISVATGSLELTNLLLKNGADKRRINSAGNTVLFTCISTEYNKVELMKLLTKPVEDQSVVEVTSNRRKIEVLLELDMYSDKIQLQEVLPDNSIEVLTSDKHEIINYLEQTGNRIQLISHLHDNILTFKDKHFHENILHCAVKDPLLTEYLLGLPNIESALYAYDKSGKTPYGHVLERRLDWMDKMKGIDQQRIQTLFEDNYPIYVDRYRHRLNLMGWHATKRKF